MNSLQSFSEFKLPVVPQKCILRTMIMIRMMMTAMVTVIIMTTEVGVKDNRCKEEILGEGRENSSHMAGVVGIVQWECLEHVHDR